MTSPRTTGHPGRLSLLILALSASALAGCRPTIRSQPALPRVNLTSAVRQPFTEALTYQSTLSAVDELPMSPEIDGRIIAMPMREGQRVKAGTLLYELDQRPQESQARADQVIAENARLNAMRFVSANFAGAVSNKESDDYVTKARQSQEISRSSKALLAYKSVRAPIDGQLGAINNKLGDYVKAGTAVTTLVNNRQLWISIDVPADLAYRLRLGQAVRIRAPGLPADQAIARVTFIAPQLDEQRQTAMVRATIDNPSGVLRHNQRIEAILELGRAARTTIPTAAAFLQAGQSFVFVAQPIRDGQYRLQLRPVRLGVPQQERYPVLAGLNAGDVVVVGDLTELNNGATVTAGRRAS